MRVLHRFTPLATVAAVAVATFVAAAPAQADTAPPSLADLLGVDGVVGNGFDSDWGDFDIVREAADAVIAAKGSATPVALLGDGSVALTAFVPTDRAFRRLVHDLTGTWQSESQVFATVASLGVDTVEAVLLYHVVAGTIDSGDAVAADGQTVTTVGGGGITVRVRSTDPLRVRLVDQDPDDLNPLLIPSALDINAGNPQVAHGINRVLRPVDL